MHFDYAPNTDYADVGSGHVLYSAPGFPAFPARLSIELFERARHAAGVDRAALWDPMCGAGGIVTTLGLTRGNAIRRILATDVSSHAIALAERNPKLVHADGLTDRAETLRQMGAEPSRIVSAERLARRMKGIEIEAGARVADATNRAALVDLGVGTIDVVIADLPYGDQTHWQSASDAPFLAMLKTLTQLLPRHSVMVFTSTDRGAFSGAPNAFRSFRHGHRTIKMYRSAEILS